jgi:DNA-binding MarR family transcriptional regulator
MKKGNILSLMGQIRESANRLIVEELEANGVAGIVPSHGGIMMHLFTSGTMTMNDLALSIRRTRPTVTVLVDKLVDCGYVKRDKSSEDSRVTFISLTEKGKKLKPVFDAVTKKLNAVLYRDLSDDESERLEEILERICGRLGC